MVWLKFDVVQKKHTHFNRQIGPTLGMLSVILGLFMTKYDQNCSFSYTPYGHTFWHQLSCLRLGFRELGNKNWHDCSSWQYETSDWCFFTGWYYFWVRASVKVEVAEKKLEIVKLCLKNERRKNKEDLPSVFFHIATHAKFDFWTLTNHVAKFRSQNVSPIAGISSHTS